MQVSLKQIIGSIWPHPLDREHALARYLWHWFFQVADEVWTKHKIELVLRPKISYMTNSGVIVYRHTALGGGGWRPFCKVEIDLQERGAEIILHNLAFGGTQKFALANEDGLREALREILPLSPAAIAAFSWNLAPDPHKLAVAS